MLRFFLILLGMAIWVVTLDAFISVTWPFWATAIVLGITFLVPGVLFANKMTYGKYLVFPWSSSQT